MHDVVVVGGGVIGLAVAYELSRRGQKVQLLEQGQPGREASWAGAGILPPGCPAPPEDPLVGLTAATNRLWPRLSEELRESTGIDNGFRRCGSIEFGENPGNDVSDEMAAWQQIGAETEPLSTESARDYEENLDADWGPCFRLPQTCQVRNPRHLKALLGASEHEGVEIVSGATAVDFEMERERVTAVRTLTDRYPAERVIICSGSWTSPLLARAGIRAEIEPIRGQIVLLSTPQPVLRHVIECGHRYLVPRPDGRLLIGATQEQAGFDKRNTATAVQDLLQFALRLCPALADAHIERIWAGLRPRALRGRPYIGPSPRFENLYLAAGHFRWGLHLSPITGLLIRQMILGDPLEIDPSPFGFAVE
ncbi:Hydrogen cyanide synthase subunit HcnC precursor [Maioricimonas rarisocia]|uniref:Hydrogen cyanide synthase subunit HcnC n=1 Tax=Maioricimonas rarisocia TaxID=2528026 RepID=A0A517Z330_9PLAN|nr:glycine oxidase ThiO [Maioricimonas rarisocia]QDU36889.1 Hydrogen cyanide synthase subunit HcnC precursor [Maioricimonas rarisocia]